MAIVWTPGTCGDRMIILSAIVRFLSPFVDLVKDKSGTNDYSVVTIFITSLRSPESEISFNADVFELIWLTRRWFQECRNILLHVSKSDNDVRSGMAQCFISFALLAPPSYSERSASSPRYTYMDNLTYPRTGVYGCSSDI